MVHVQGRVMDVPREGIEGGSTTRAPQQRQGPVLAAEQLRAPVRSGERERVEEGEEIEAQVRLARLARTARTAEQRLCALLRNQQ